jgi:signal transduction histidine kinase
MSAQAPARPHIERWPSADALLLLLATAVLTGGASWWVSVQVPAGDQLLVGVVGGVLSLALCVALGVASYRTRRARQADQRARRLESELIVLADRLLPGAVRRLRDGASADTVIAETPSMSEVHRHIVAMVVREIAVGERQRAAAMAACASAAGRVQAMATSMLADLREMEHRHDEHVLGDLLRLDHSTAQAGRLADSIAVLTGARSGRRWTKPISMESILRGAMGRINAYRRIQLHSSSTVAIVGYAAEGVMHALAELMDNATNFSPPSEQVNVYVQEVQAGVVVTIEDSGLRMSESALRRAERAVSTESLDLTTLSGTRLGLAVVGNLTRKYGLTVSFRPSSRGGTGVVVMIPQRLITELRDNTAATRGQSLADSLAAPRNPSPKSTVTQPAAPDGTVSTTPGDQGGRADRSDLGYSSDLGGLPKRPRGRTLAATDTARTPTPRPGRPRSVGPRFAAFRDAARSGGEGHPEDKTP